ncbi:hypothetical protein F511_28484 [Dorcoceras hygrometricum]|uniref:Triacylglycerol lipase n=1 Tax=Dorcoceras hygrometricum TaxID=472368 RepID=A0A2Z7A5H1_9LAMI|nr:hypothetical protein F511_28484 [Dorcoceras hygrometricum]
MAAAAANKSGGSSRTSPRQARRTAARNVARPAAIGCAFFARDNGQRRPVGCASATGRPPCEKEAANSRPPCASSAHVARARSWLQPESQGDWLFTVGGGRLRLIRSTTGFDLPPISLHYKADGFYHERNHLVARIRTSPIVRISDDGGRRRDAAVGDVSTCVTLNGSGIQLAVGPQPLRLRNHNFGLAHRIMVKRLATSRHDPLGITDSACKNQLVVVSVQYGPFNPYIPIRSTTIVKSRVAKDPIAMHTSWRSNIDTASVTRVTMTFRVVRTNQYNQDLELIHSTNGNHLESPNEGSSIDHQVTIYLHAQNITMFPTNETWYFPSQILVSSSGGLILILTVQSTRN